MYTNTEKMPDTIQACPRGTGTVSGVWTDLPCGDEPEISYTRTDIFDGVCKQRNDLLETVKSLLAPFEGQEEYELKDVLSPEEVAAIYNARLVVRKATGGQ